MWEPEEKKCEQEREEKKLADVSPTFKYYNKNNNK